MPLLGLNDSCNMSPTRVSPILLVSMVCSMSWSMQWHTICSSSILLNLVPFFRCNKLCVDMHSYAHSVQREERISRGLLTLFLAVSPGATGANRGCSIHKKRKPVPAGACSAGPHPVPGGCVPPHSGQRDADVPASEPGAGCLPLRAEPARLQQGT
jgi:hypothetical protein